MVNPIPAGSQMWDPISAGNLDGGDPISAGNLDGGNPISIGNLDVGIPYLQET